MFPGLIIDFKSFNAVHTSQPDGEREMTRNRAGYPPSKRCSAGIPPDLPLLFRQKSARTKIGVKIDP